MNMTEKYPQAPVHLLDAIRSYADNHTPVGDFLTAVLANDLRAAFGKADLASRRGLFHIVMYCHWEIPSNCWGSPEAVQAWLIRGWGDDSRRHTKLEDMSRSEQNEYYGEGGILDAEEDQAYHDRQAEEEEGA